MKASRPYYQPTAAGLAALEKLSPAKRAKQKRVGGELGHWVHVYRDEHGRRRRQVCLQCKEETEAIAHNFEIQKRELAIAEGRERRRLGTTSTWAQWSEHYRQTVVPRMVSKGPLLSFLKRMDAAWAELNLASITTRECGLLLAAAEADGLAASSLRQLYARARAVFERAVKEKWVDANPWSDVDAPSVELERPVALTHDQVGALIRHAGEWTLLLLVAVLCGLRRGELAALRWEDVQFEQGAHGVIHVRRSWEQNTTKNKKSRMVPVHPSLVEPLREARQAATSELVFPNRAGEMRHPDWKTAELIRRIASKASVALPSGQVLTFRMLRRSFATSLAQHARDGVALKDLMGHSSLQVTERHYLAENVAQLEAAVASLPAFDWQESTSPAASPESSPS